MCQDRLTAATATAELSYDAAGSTTWLRVEGIGALTYNHLALTQRVTFTPADSLVYRWGATGQKVGATRYHAGQVLHTTAYVAGGAWVYEADTLRYWRTGEGRALWQPTNATHPLAYEYNIADHLGNVRVSFRAGERRTYLASLALSQRGRETHEFDSLSIERPRTAVTAASDGYVARLTATGNATATPLGPTWSRAVQRGDTVRAEARFYYDPQGAGATRLSVNLLSLVTSWLTQTPPRSADGQAAQPSLPWVSVALGAGQPLLSGLWGTGVPRAYLRVVAFDADSALVQERILPLTSAAAGSWQTLTGQVVAPADGHVLVYVASESERAVDVDDVTVRYQPGLRVQEQHDDPFGLELVGLSRNGLVPTNRYLFNGKEAQAELGLTAWTDHGWRQYDAALGRWHVVDPAFDAAGQISWSGYQFGFDNPVRYNDLDGRVGSEGDCQGCPPGIKARDNGTFRTYQPNGAEQLQTALSTPVAGIGAMNGMIGLAQGAGRALYGVADNAYTWGTGFGTHGPAGAHNLAGHHVDPKDYEQAGFNTITGIAGLMMGVAEASTGATGASELTEFSGTSKPWLTGATPNSKYTHLDPKGRAIQNAVYNAEGNVVGHVDFKRHGSAASGHGHIMTQPGVPASGARSWKTSH